MHARNILKIMLLCAVSSLSAQEQSSSPNSTNAIVEWVNPGWTAEEEVLSKALAIRAARLEKASGIKFDEKGYPKADLEYSVAVRNERNIAARYNAEKQWIEFPISLTYQLNVTYKTSVRLMDPSVLAKDESFVRLADHELGHALSDQVSRRSGNGPFFTIAYFDTQDPEVQLGLNIIAEGMGLYFETLLQTNKPNVSEFHFPASLEQLAACSFDTVTLDGGNWIVHDVLVKHGEKGMRWLVSHRFSASSINMRRAAVVYRNLALHELAQ